MTTETLSYWLVNVPRDQWPDECPDFLVNANAKDRGILSTMDEDYSRLSWPEAKRIVEANRIDLLQRVPSDLRRYLAYTHTLKKEYGSVMNFIIQERLNWKDFTPRNAEPLIDTEDLKILYNDWPYGIDEDIVHLVVWTKHALDPDSDDLTPHTRAMIDRYVIKTFQRAAPQEKIIWFKNWKSLKSIHAVEHFHVMLYQPNMDEIREITNHDTPLSAKLPKV